MIHDFLYSDAVSLRAFGKRYFEAYITDSLILDENEEEKRGKI